MSGGRIPYHLRTNKSVERSIFMELLMKIHTYRKINNYRYIGFGALYMEDFKLIHSLFSIKNLTCLENDTNTFQRQKFNVPLKCITLLNQSSGEFISNYDAGKNSIVWLDYANPNQIYEQINEFEQLIDKCIEFDVIKITLNASPDTLVNKQSINDPIRLRKERLDKLTQKLGKYMPSGVTSDMMTVKKLSKVLLKSLQNAYDQMLPPVIGRQFVPLTSFTYNDGPHQMMTLTGIILDKKNKTNFLNETGLSNWEYYIGKFHEPIEINMPDLTIKERLAIDSYLPNCKAQTIQNKLKFLFDDNQSKSLNKIESYKRFYRHYPYFSRINI
jgi:hypothetical protein